MANGTTSDNNRKDNAVHNDNDDVHNDNDVGV